MRWTTGGFVKFHAPDEPYPSALNELIEEGVPRRMFAGYYEALDELRPVRGPGGQHLTAFGRSGDDYFGVDESTAHVLLLSSIDGETRFVNTTVGRFSSMVESVTRRFPYYGRDH